MWQLRRIATVSTAAVALLALLSGCAASPYVYVSDTTDQAFFKVPTGWSELNAQSLADAQQSMLGRSAAGPSGGVLAWSRAYSATADPGAADVFTSASQPMVYSSVQKLGGPLRQDMSFDEMRDLLFPVTSQARQQAAAEGQKLVGFSAVTSRVITNSDGVRGINELFVYDIGGAPNAFDLTVLTNSKTTKLYLLLVQCNQGCFAANYAQIKAVVNSFAVRGS